MRGRSVAAHVNPCSSCLELDQAGRGWLDRGRDETGRSWETPRRLDPAIRGYGEDRRRGRLHGREHLEWSLLHCPGCGGVAGAVGEDRTPMIHAGHCVPAGKVPLEQTERGTPHRGLGHKEGGQSREG
jgi:hypothetical protein